MNAHINNSLDIVVDAIWLISKAHVEHVLSFQN